MPENPPKDWPQISPALFYDDAPAAIAWLERAFGFETRLKVEAPDGGIVHSELVFGTGVLMVASAGEPRPGLSCGSPASNGGTHTVSLYVFVDDVDAHCERARAAGATIVAEPTTKHYGDRGYEALDCEGYWWAFGQRVDDAAYEAAARDHGN